MSNLSYRYHLSEGDSKFSYRNLNEHRRQLIQERDVYLNMRKTLSAEIGKLMRSGKQDEVGELKAQVETASQGAAGKEEDLEEVINMYVYV
eukprot:1393249-Amorphochlora_amoeboformis.AAC.1